MPDKMYLDWLQSVGKEKAKYYNAKMKAVLSTKE